MPLPGGCGCHSSGRQSYARRPHYPALPDSAQRWCWKPPRLYRATGRTLRERLLALAAGVNAEQCPFNDPHTAAPHLWLLLSTITYSSNAHARPSLATCRFFAGPRTCCSGDIGWRPDYRPRQITAASIPVTLARRTAGLCEVDNGGLKCQATGAVPITEGGAVVDFAISICLFRVMPARCRRIGGSGRTRGRCPCDL